MADYNLVDQKPSPTNAYRQALKHVNMLKRMSPSAERDALLDKATQELILLKQAANKASWLAREGRPKRERIYVTKDVKRVVDYLKGNPQRLSELLFEAASAEPRVEALPPAVPVDAKPNPNDTFEAWLISKGQSFAKLNPAEREMAYNKWMDIMEAPANQ